MSNLDGKVIIIRPQLPFVTSRGCFHDDNYAANPRETLSCRHALSIIVIVIIIIVFDCRPCHNNNVIVYSTSARVTCIILLYCVVIAPRRGSSLLPHQKWMIDDNTV